MMDDTLLLKYVGRVWTSVVKREIEEEFYPYKIRLCSNAMSFYRSNIINNVIRCIVVNDRIFNLSFN